MKQNERRTAFILAAGLGTRLKELTSENPKALVELNKQPLLEVVLENLISQKFNHFVINVHHFADKIIDFLKSKNYKNVEIEISDERDFLYNTGGGILKALPYFKDSKAVLIHNVDIVTDIDFQAVYDDFIKSEDAAWLLTQERDNKRKLVFDNNDCFVGRFNLETNEYDGEVPFCNDFKLMSFSGLHIIKPEYFSKFELNACYVFDLYKDIAKKAAVKSKHIKSEYWFDLGTQKQLEEASTMLLSRQSFISKISNYITDNYNLTKDLLTIIFPNKRAALELRKELEKIKKNIWLPNIISIQEAMSMWSGMQLLDNIDVIFELLKVINDDNLSADSNLFGLASQMAKDFDEIDQYKVCAKDIFEYVKDAKEADTWNPSEAFSETEKRYLAFFASLLKYYNKLRENLKANNWGYYGMITRTLSELPDEKLLETVGDNKVIFAGFNAMTATEEDIIVRLERNDKAVILWDLDKYYFNDTKQEAGLFARNFLDKYKNIKRNFIEDNFNNKNINIIGVSGSTIQTNALTLQLSKEKKKINSKEVVVLSDETLLLPVLNSIPTSYSDIFVTMGYPYSKTVLHQFLNHLFSFQNNINTKDETVYFWGLKRLLETELIKIIFTKDELSSLDDCLNTLIKKSTYYIEINDLQEYFKGNICNFILLLCKKWSPENCVVTINSTLKFISQCISSDKLFIKNQLSIAGRIFNKIERLSLKYKGLIKMTDIETLYKQSANEMSVKLEKNDEHESSSSPTLQVMGLLETRNIDFDIVHILSVNEGILPQSKSANSLIPYDIRKHYKLPLYKNKQAVYAYHFYRLIQKAKTVNIYYNTLADGMGEGEPSRFIRQILHEIPVKTNNINIINTVYKNPIINVKNIFTFKIDKTDDIIAKIVKKITGKNDKNEIIGLSPTSIACYLKCPMQFYLKYIEDVKDNTPEETIQSNVIGSIIHSTFENLYNEFTDNHIDYKSYIEIVESKLSEAYQKALETNKFPNGLPDNGFNYLSKIMINELIDNFIEYEKTFFSNGNTLKIIGLEKNLHHTFNINGIDVNLIGFADRIDMANGKTIRILDYKSGSVKDSDVEISKDVKELKDLSEKSLQLLIYKYLYKKMNKNIAIENIEPAIFGLLKMNRVFFPLKNYSDSFNDYEDGKENFMNICDNLFTELFKELLDKEKPFEQTANNSDCKYCSFTDICKRNSKNMF